MSKIVTRRGRVQRKLGLRIWVLGFRHRAALKDMAGGGSRALTLIGQERPTVLVGPLVWPYLCAAWDAPERLERIAAHYRIIDRLGAPFPFSANESLVLADLDETHPQLRIVLDQPQWFMREGGLTLNLFVGDFRAYSLAFSFAPSGQDHRFDCLIGAIQGRNTGGANDIYRDLTKAAHGLRPRDLLIETCRILCRHWHVVRLLAVRDAHRHHRHPFFGGKGLAPQDYDAIWKDRGGSVEDAHFYRLPLEFERRSEDDIKPNKRSLYRRRYRFLDQLEAQITTGLPLLKSMRFEDR